jgi:hypothetical protein
MKTILFLLLFTSSAMVFLSCDQLGLTKEKDSELNGNTSIPINTVGNQFSPVIIIDGASVASDATIKITNSVNGENTIEFKADLSKTPALSRLNSIIPANLKDSNGKVNFTTRVKMTDEGILDYSNSDNAPFVAVRFEGNVGDTYTLSKSDGKTSTRTITQKSTTDDYAWGGMLIKIIKVEQVPSFPGVKKYEYWFNHKFGLVGVVITAEDNSKLSFKFTPTNY